MKVASELLIGRSRGTDQVLGIRRLLVLEVREGKGAQAGDSSNPGASIVREGNS